MNQLTNPTTGSINMGTTANSVVGIGTPFAKAQRRLFNASFFTPKFYGGPCWASSEGRPFAGSSNPVRPATLSLGTDGGSSQRKQKDNTMSTISTRTQVAPIAVTHGVPLNHDLPSGYQSLTASERLQVALAMLNVSMHETQLSLHELRKAEDEATALRAARALSLLETCRDKFVDLMGVQS